MLERITEMPTDKPIAGIHTVPFQADGSIVMGWNTRAGLLETVGGRIEPGETLELALQREAAEEAGIKLEGPYRPFAKYYWASTDTYTVWVVSQVNGYVPMPPGFETSGRVVMWPEAARAMIGRLAHDQSAGERITLLTWAEETYRLLCLQKRAAAQANPIRVRGGIILVEDGKVALIRRERNGQVYYVVPGGGVEEGESPAEAAVREAMEELCIQVCTTGEALVLHFKGSRQHYFWVERTDHGQPPSRLGPAFTDLYRGRGSYVPVWVPVEQLAGLDLRPPQVATLLREIRTQGQF